MKQITSRQLVLPVSSLRMVTINPPIRITENKLKELKLRVEQTCFIEPLTVRKQNDGTYLIMNGNRRYTIAKELKIAELPCTVIDSTMSDKELFRALNTSLKFDGRQKLYLMRGCDLFFSDKDKNTYNWAIDIGGIELVDFIIENNKNISTINTFTTKLSTYLSIFDKNYIKKIIYWMVENSQAYMVRKAIEGNMNKKLIKQAIDTNKSLKGILFN